MEHIKNTIQIAMKFKTKRGQYIAFNGAFY